MTVVAKLLPKQSANKGLVSLLVSLPNLLPMVPLANPGWEPGKVPPRTGKSNGTARKGKSNDLPRKAKRELQE